VTFLSPRFRALPDDPAAGHPDAEIVADFDQLRALLVGELTRQHAEPLFATLREVAPYGIPAMRANYIDRLASAALWIADELGDPELARREVTVLVTLASPNGRSRTGLLEITHPDTGRSRLFLRRGGCCLNYRLPGREKCDTCCLRPHDERMMLLRETYLA
jgi:hypothetical protein